MERCALECIEWVGFKTPKGYGSGYDPNTKKTRLAHRLSWEENVGEIPKGLCVLHKCDNRCCINPDHLFLGTQDDNMKDMVSKGRQHNPTGEKNGRAKLTNEVVVELKKRLTEGITQAKIAKEFNISRGQVAKIAVGLAWSHI